MFEKNQLVTLTVTDMSTEGEGIGRADGIPVFAKDTVIGDEAEVRIIKVKKNMCYGRLEKVLTPSPFRTEPVCKLYRKCGGCQLQAMQYEEQLKYKQNKVKNNLLRIGGFEETFLMDRMEPIVGMEKPFFYRNKAQYPIGNTKEGSVVAGFYAGRTHDIIANTDCAIGVSENEVILRSILSYAEDNHIMAYDEETGRGLLRHVLIRKGFDSKQLMVCLVINKKPGKGELLPRAEQLLQKLCDIPHMHSISVSFNTEKTNVIMGKETKLLWGEERIEDTIYIQDLNASLMGKADGEFTSTGKGITFRISPLSFYQVNPKQTERLYSIALSYANLQGSETVWDLYCGIGTISLFLAGKAGKVYGVEVIPQAIEDARENAKRNQITNTEFFVGKAEEVLPAKYKEEGIKADVIVVDPPRKGCDEACLSTMLQMQPQKIVYVSCDSATLARDLKILTNGGYELMKWRPVDMFPHTVHVETVCLLSKLHEAKNHVDVKLNMEELDITSAESKATYEEIQKYVLEKTGLKVSNLYIAQTKKKCGIEVGENFNLPKSENARQPKCPKDKEDAIVEALKFFQMI